MSEAISQQPLPKLRFPEFREAWEEKRLGDIAEFTKGKGIAKADVSEDGETECIRYGQLYTDYSEKIDHVISRTNVHLDDLVLSQANDIIIPASGETQIDIATASCVVRGGIALGGDLNIIRVDENGVFLSYLLNSKKKLDIARLSQGISVVHLYSTQLKTLKLTLPSQSEQTKIASFLGAVDDKISQLTQKKVLLEDYKKACLQKLFSQDFRFKDHDGKEFPDWNWRSLSSLGERRIVKNIDFEFKRVLTNSATQGVVLQSDYFDNDVAKAGNIDGYYIVKKGDFVYNPRISATAPVGPIKRNNITDGVMSPLYTIFRLKNDYAKFYEQFFNSNLWHKYMKKVANFGARHDRMAINTKDFLALPLPYPDEGEQKKIVEFLCNLDAKIVLANSELEHAKAFKLALLQQMFV